MDSLIFLAKLCPPSLLFGSYYDWWGGLYSKCADEWERGPSGALCIFPPKVLEVSPMYSSSQERSPHWTQYMSPLLLTIESLSLGETSRFLIVLLPLKWVWMPYLPQIFLILSTQTLVCKVWQCDSWFLTSLIAGWAPLVSQLLALSGSSLEGLLSLETRGAQLATNEVKTKGHIVIPYTQGMCESIKKICGRYGIQTHFKGSNTIRNLLVSPKDKDSMVSKSEDIYWVQCGDLSCDDEYIGETSRTFGERYKEHLKDPSPIHQHIYYRGHSTSHNNFQIIGREGIALLEILKSPYSLVLIIPH